MTRSGRLFASYAGFTILAWYLSAMGAVLPPLRDEAGNWAGVYALLPGAVLFGWGLITLARGSRSTSDREPNIAVGLTVLTISIGVMGVTGAPAISLIGAAVAAIAAAHVNRTLPGMLATASGGRPVQPVLMRANAFSSVAAIIAPLAVGASLAIGAGWITGYVVPIAIGAVLVCALAMRAGGPERSFETMDPAPLPPFRHWWRACAVLGVAVVVEFCFTYFAVTYLHDERGLSKAAAAAGGAAWGIGMAIGRFAFSVRQPPPSIVPSAAVILAGFVLFWGVPNSAVAIIGITIAGLGVAPLYPSRIIILMERFPGATHEGSKRAALASGWALLVAPALMVSLRAASNVRVAYLVVPVLLVLLVALASPRWEHSRHLVAA
ncbi:MAG TPA: hypothetical protein VH419_05425 [Nocardioidaceae bacterium]